MNEHGVGFVDKVGIECLCGWTCGFDSGVGGWVAFNHHLSAVHRTMVERAAQVAERHAERLKHTTHHDGLGMGWLAGEEACRDIAASIRRLDDQPDAPMTYMGPQATRRRDD